MPSHFSLLSLVPPFCLTPSNPPENSFRFICKTDLTCTLFSHSVVLIIQIALLLTSTIHGASSGCLFCSQPGSGDTPHLCIMALGPPTWEIQACVLPSGANASASLSNGSQTPPSVAPTISRHTKVKSNRTPWSPITTRPQSCCSCPFDFPYPFSTVIFP